MTLTKVSIASLVEDFSIYPRHAVDNSHANSIVEAILAGVKLPPIVIEKDSGRIVDGFHRSRAYRIVLGSDGQIDVDVQSFKTPADLIAAAVGANVSHGRPLDKVDRARCALLLEQAGLEPRQVAITLNVREEVLPKITLRLASVPDGSPGVVPGTNQLPLKQVASHLVGRTLTREQAAAHVSMPGTSLTLLARQLIRAVEGDLVDRQNSRLMQSLRELQVALGSFLAPPVTSGGETPH